MKLKKIMLSVLMLTMMASVAGCSSVESAKNNDKNEGETVIATSVAVVEILDKLGVKVDGVPNTSYELPESCKDAIKVGNPMNPDLEIIKSLNPKIVVSVDTLGQDFMDMFTENNIPSEFIDLTSLGGLKESVESLGKTFNKEESAKSILEELATKEEELASKSEGKEKPNVLTVFGAPGTMMLGTSKSYIGNLVQLSGGENALESNTSSFLPINKEELINLDPDVIVVMTHADPENSKQMVEEAFNSDAGWKNLSAVKNNKIHYLENNYFGMSANLKVIEALDKMHKMIYE